MLLKNNAHSLTVSPENLYRTRTYLYKFVNTQGLVQLSQFTLISPTEEGDKLLQQSFLIISAFRCRWRAEHFIQRTGHTLPAYTD